MSELLTVYGTIQRGVCLMLAIHFLNCSIDSRDSAPDSIAEDLTKNDIESATEFLAEVVLGCEDFFREHEEKDTEDRCSSDIQKFYFGNHPLVITCRNAAETSVRKTGETACYNIDSRPQETSSPPPKV